MNNDDVGYGNPPKHNQFPRGTSGNPRGRPRKAERFLIPRQAREDVLRISEETRTVKTEGGVRTMSGMELYFRTVHQRALAGNPTAMKLWMEFLMSALKERVEAHGPLKLLENMLDDEDRAHVRLHEFTQPHYDLKKISKKLY